MHVTLLPFVLAPTHLVAVAEALRELAKSSAGLPEKILPTVHTGKLMQNLVAIGREYLLPFAIHFLAALAIFVVGRWVARFVTAQTRRLMTRAKVDETLRKFLCNMTYALLLVVVLLASLDELGVDTTSLTAILATAGLAVGFALRDSLANFAAGVLLIMFKPFRVGDFVEAGGASGAVEEIQLFTTYLRTGDNVQIIVPNGMIANASIKNFSAKRTRRIDLTVGCGYQDNLRDVRQFLIDLLQNDARILDDPEPLVAVEALCDNSVNFVVRPWVASGDYWSTRRDLTEAIKNGFDERGFHIPFPTREIHVHQAG